MERNAHRADVVAGATQGGCLRDLPTLCLAAEERREHRTDRTTVHPAIGVPTNLPIHRTDVLARTATDAVERLFEFATEQRAATGIEQHDVRALRPVGLVVAPRTAGDRHVRRDLLPRSVARQQRQQHCEISPPGDQLLDPDERDVDARHRRRQPSVAFVRHEQQLAGLGD